MSKHIREDILDAHEDIDHSQPLMNIDKPILKEGWLKKESKYLGQNRKRWIVFQYGNHIYSYKKKQQYKYHTEDIDLNKLKQIDNDNNDHNNNNNQFILIYKDNNDENKNKNKNKNIYKFTANSKHDKNEWISTIKNWLTFNNEIKEYKRKWRKLINQRTIKTMENECLSKTCISLHDCNPTKRIIFILNFYRIWCLKNFVQNKWIGISIESILKYEFIYNSIQLINDMNHILNNHYYKNKTLFFNFFIHELGICGRRKSQCIMYLRNYRNKFKLQTNDILRNKIYFQFIKYTDIISMQLLDSYHSFVFHHDYQIEDDDDDDDEKKYDNDDNDIITLLNHNQDKTRYRKYLTCINNNNDDNKNKFGDNFSYWPIDNKNNNYISAKFNSLKQEMLYNNIYCLTQFEWNLIREKAMKYKYCVLGKKMVSNNISSWNKRTEIKNNTTISIKHIIVILLNTNYSQLSILFKQQCQKQNKNETIFNLKKRNQVIANFCKLLFESVYLFGSVMFRMDQQNYYHCLNGKPLFNSFKLNFKSPISCSTNINLIKEYNKNDKGCILQLKSLSDGIMPYFHINFLTDYIKEDEKLLFRIHLNINDIIIVNNNNNNNHLMMKSFKLFIAIIDGSFFIHIDDLMDIKTQNCLIKMLNDNNNNNKNDNENDNYIQKLFNHYIKNNESSIWINENELEFLDKTLYKIFMLYLENKKNINKIQLFSWHINYIDNIENDENEQKINGPTLLYTLNDNNNNNYNDSFQIAFDSFYRIKSENNDIYFYFRLSSFPINFKCITASFYILNIETNISFQILQNKMSIYTIQGVKQICHKIKNNQINNIKDHINNKKLTLKIAVKVTDYQLLSS